MQQDLINNLNDDLRDVAGEIEKHKETIREGLLDYMSGNMSFSGEGRARNNSGVGLLLNNLKKVKQAFMKYSIAELKANKIVASNRKSLPANNCDLGNIILSGIYNNLVNRYPYLNNPQIIKNGKDLHSGYKRRFLVLGLQNDPAIERYLRRVTRLANKHGISITPKILNLQIKDLQSEIIQYLKSINVYTEENKDTLRGMYVYLKMDMRDLNTVRNLAMNAGLALTSNPTAYSLVNSSNTIRREVSVGNNEGFGIFTENYEQLTSSTPVSNHPTLSIYDAGPVLNQVQEVVDHKKLTVMDNIPFNTIRAIPYIQKALLTLSRKSLCLNQ